MQTNLDLFSHRKGRLDSMVTTTWEKEFKNVFLEELENIVISNQLSNISQVWERDYRTSILYENVVFCINQNSSNVNKASLDLVHSFTEISELTADIFVSWLGTKSGLKFISTIYDVKIDEPPFMFSVQNQLDTPTLLKKINENKVVVRIVIDTLAGWLNSDVGRGFIRTSLNIDVPQSDSLGTE